MKPKIYTYSKCSTCRKALVFLDSLDAEYDTVDIVLHPPSKKELGKALRSSGMPIKKFFNTSGQSYREGDFGARLATLSEDAALTALAADGKLIKRPLLIGEGYAIAGFDEAAYVERFG